MPLILKTIVDITFIALVSNGTLRLTVSQTIYVEVGINGALTQNNLGYSADKAPLYKIITNTTGVASYEDHRSASTLNRLFAARTSVSPAAANVTLIQAHALCESIEFTGVLTTARTVIFSECGALLSDCLCNKWWADHHA